VDLINLEWEKYPFPIPMTWEEANEYAFSLKFNWRIPTKEEIILASKNKIDGFGDFSYWTNSEIPEKYKYQFPKTHCVVTFRNEFINYKKNNELYHVRCVRNI
jgi:hypothetical protein